MTWLLEKFLDSLAVIGACFIAFLLVAGYIGFAERTTEFKRECADRGGKTVHNGRHFVCMKGDIK